MCKPQRIFSATPNSEEMELLRTLFEPQDRKSTRLNSSHGYISYAVFCLKKKNNSDPNSLAYKAGRCASICRLVRDPHHPGGILLPTLPLDLCHRRHQHSDVRLVRDAAP